MALYNNHARYTAEFSQRLLIRTRAHIDIALLAYSTYIFENHSLTPYTCSHAHVGIIDHLIYKYIYIKNFVKHI